MDSFFRDGSGFSESGTAIAPTRHYHTPQDHKGSRLFRCEFMPMV